MAKLHGKFQVYVPPNIVRVINSRRMGWVRNVARTGKLRNAYRFLDGNRRGKRPLGTPRCGLGGEGEY
jgi:hypothetical protein